VRIVGDPATVQEFRPRRRLGVMLLALLAALCFIAVNLWLWPRAEHLHFFDSALLCVGGVAAILMLWQILSRRTLVFSPAGLEFGIFGRRKRVAWSNIESTIIRRNRADAVNGLWLKDPAAVDGYDDSPGEGFMRAVNLMLGRGHFAFDWSQRDRGAEAFDALLNVWIERYGSSAVR